MNRKQRKQINRRKNNIRELRRWIDKLAIKDTTLSLPDIISALTLFDVAERQEEQKESN